MKKGTKFLLIGGFALTLIGFMIVWAGVVIGGPATIERMLDNGEFTININGSPLYLLGGGYDRLSILENDLSFTSESFENIGEKGSIHTVKVNIGGGIIRIEESNEQDSFAIKYKCKGTPCTWKVEDGILLIDNTKEIQDYKWQKEADKITLYVPKGTELDALEIDLGGGEMQLNNLLAKKTIISMGAGELIMDNLISSDLNVEIGAGEIKAENSKTENLMIDMAMGNAEFEGLISKNAEINCSMGNVELELAGREEDYNYSIDCSAGNVEIEGSEYTGLGVARYIDNQAEKEISIECSMGSVEIDF